MATIAATMFLPGFVLGIASCWHKNMLKTIVAHPSVVLMPAFTHFSFECSRGRNEEGEGESENEEKSTGGSTPAEPFITFSPKFTIINIILSIFGNVVYGLSLTQIDRSDETWYSPGPAVLPKYHHVYLLSLPIPILGLFLTLSSLIFLSNSSRIHFTVKYTLANLIFNTAAYLVFFISLVDLSPGSPYPWAEHIYFLPVPIFGLLVTILKVILSHYCNINLPACFSLPGVEYGALVCSDPQAHYVLGADGKPEHVLEDEEEV